MTAANTLSEKLGQRLTTALVMAVSWICRMWSIGAVERSTARALRRDRFASAGAELATAPHTVLVYVWKAQVLTGSAGHVMITEDDARLGHEPTVILSQFPHSPGGRSRPRGPNVPLEFHETMRAVGRRVDFVFRVRIRHAAAFDAEVARQRARPQWDCHPATSEETHCARAAYDALKAGGVPLSGADSGQIFPWTFRKHLERMLGTTYVAVHG